MEENTQLPVEAVECINNWIVTFALAYHKRKDKDISNDAAEFITDELSMPNALTAYATKLHQANTYNELLKTEIKHLNAVIESLKSQPGSVWLKASERLPGWKKRVKWRDGNNHSYATDGEISLFEMEKPNLEGWEWLDESPATFNPELFRIISDAEQSKEEDLKAVKEVIGGAAAGREDDAVAFADWIRENYESKKHTGWKKHGTEKPYYSTAELYELFKQQKEK